MNQLPVTHQSITSAHCAPWRQNNVSRTLLLRHVINKQSVFGATRKARKGIYCQRTAVSELEDVDPLTGEIVSGVKSKFPKQTVTASGLEWAYRRSPGEADTTEKQQAVLLLHGIGSASYSFRETCELLDKAGYTAIAADWPGHGGSSKPDPSQFDYSQKSYLKALDAFVDQIELQKPFHLVVQGFILGQYAMLWALSNPDKINKLIVLNTPVGRKSKLRPELAAYKTKMAMFRPDPKKKRFDGANFNAAGGAYQMQGTVAAAYDWPYQEPGPASVAVAETMKQVDFQALLAEVNNSCKSWRKPTLFLFGTADPFIDQKTVFDFVEDKRTNFSLKPSQSRMGHMPQEDYPEVLQESITEFLQEP